MKNKTTATLLAFFLGGLGIHRFYLNQIVLGILYLIFSWTFIPLIIAFIDFIVLAAMSKEKFDLKYSKTKNSNLNNQGNELVSVTSKATGERNQSELSISLNEEKIMKLLQEKQRNREQEIKSFRYIPNQIQGQGIQLLESFSILNTTKSLDTLIGRYEFIDKMYDDFVKASHNQRYITDIQVSIDKYKSMYYDRVINDFELALLVKPDFSNLSNYYADCLFNSYERFFNEQMEQIENLKKDDAKQKRKAKLFEVGNQTIIEFDKIECESEKFNTRIQQLKDILEIVKPADTFVAPKISSKKLENPIVINPNRSFELTLYNANSAIVKKVVSIIKDENLWNKSKELVPLFSLHNIRCKEVEEYISKYKPHYLKLTQELIDSSQEYQEATEKDKEIIENEFKESVLNKLPERAHCDLIKLFDYSDIDCTIDDKIVDKYGFEVISKYFGLNHYSGKVITHWERKDFEDLIKAGLVFTSDEIDREEILTAQTLKILNKICDKEESFFKRKNKAIEYLQENPELLKNIGKHVSTRNLFKLKPLPNELEDLNIEEIQNHWVFLKEYTSLIVDTYNSSERHYEDTKGDISWVKKFSIEKHEDFDSECVCLRAREESKKKYSKSNPPKLPFHIGCNCSLRIDV